MNRKTLVILAGIAMFIALFALTFVPASQVAAQGPTPTPVPPVAKLEVVAMPGNAAVTGAITATVKYVTETNTASTTAALYTSGLSNAPINVPVYLKVSAVDPKNSGNAVWSLTKPVDSKAVITNVTTITTAMVAKFTPDVVGAYMVQVTLKNAAGVTSAPQFASFNAGTYIGTTAGNCKNCHPTKTAEWAKTGHAVLFSEELDNQVDGPLGVQPSGGYITHYSETCSRCHATGWYPAPYNGSGGYWDTKEKAKWTFPTFKQIDEVFTKKTPSNWAAAPAEVKNMGTIGCEVCHGPAEQHVKNEAKSMDVTFDNGVCNQCHAAGGHHIKGNQIVNSKHSEESSMAWAYPVGASHQECVRCHSGKGYASFIANPKNQAAWNNEMQTVGCATCHDPHSEANMFQLRIVGKPVELPFANVKDVGLSATCEECHNNRTDPANAVKGMYPHYSSAAEMLSDAGGVTYGATVPNSPHSMLIGNAPIPNPAYTGKDPSVAKFMFSKNTDAKGNIPGPCVTCHMSAGLSDAKDPNFGKVGEHSFNMVSPDGKFDNGASCKSCHGEVKDFNLKAKADYDGNGKVEGVQDELKGVLNATWKALEAKGYKKVATGYPYATVPADASDNTKNAWYNFRYVYGVMWGANGDGNQGAAAAVHNFKRSCALLQLSIKDLTGSLPAGAADCTK